MRRSQLSLLCISSRRSSPALSCRSRTLPLSSISPAHLVRALFTDKKVGEVEELSEIFQWKAEVPRGLPYWKKQEKQHLGEVLSDVLLYLVRLSDVCGIDLGKAAPRKLELNAIKYQVKICKGSSKKYTQLNAKDNTTMCFSDYGMSGTKNSSCER